LRTLDERQKRILKIHDNLRHDANIFRPTQAEPKNFARELFDDFMQEPSFVGTMKSIAKDFGRGDLLKSLDEHKPQGQRTGIAPALMDAVERGDDDMLVDLVKEPESPTYSLSELNTFWNVAANIQARDPEVYTHLIADKKYLEIFDQTVAANEYKGEGVEKLRAEIVKSHETAAKTVNEIGYDKFQLLYSASAASTYDSLAKGDFKSIGEGLTADAPKTVFTGLGVKEPLAPEKLTEVAVSVDDYYGRIQAEKNIRALPLPEDLDPQKLKSQMDAFRQAAEPRVQPEERPLPDLMAQFRTHAAPDITGSAEEKKYAVQKGDNLWKIAKDQYGLKNYKDIMRAVEHIAAKNDLDQGVKANHIDVGQTLKMPSADEIKKPVQKLDWAALDADKMGVRKPAVLALAQ
jgi:nucleoid-associated protein YgaU